MVPDKFKGTLRADEAAECIAAGWRATHPADTLELLPMSDGGDGFGQIIGSLLRADRQSTSTLNAAHEPIHASWWWSEANRTAIVESANVIGLAMLPAGRFHPFELDTLGLGQLLHHISKQHAGARLVIGIGGSATNDGGFGLARGLGFRFFDTRDYCLDHWVELSSLLRIERPHSPSDFTEVTIATDVQNQLLGPEGASQIYGPQKGLRPDDLQIAEKCLTQLAEIVRSELGLDCAKEPGTGAAGGLGYGLRVFLDGTFESGFDIFTRLSNLESRIAAADLIITAEGSIDAQTEMGKGTGAIATLARKHKKRCLGLAGYLPQKENRAFDLTLGIAPDLTNIEDAKRQPAFWLEKLAALAATKARFLVLTLVALLFAACQSPSDRTPVASPESRAINFLAREVPAWSRENGCYSCHNNGDGARALFVGLRNKYAISNEAIEDTLAWITAPENWGKNKGDPGFSDQRLADIQFAATLLSAIELRLVRNPTALDQAAARLVPHQSENGAWDVEPQNPAGSPVTYGTALATYLAWKTLSAAGEPSSTSARKKAERWLASAKIDSVTSAAALLLFAAETRDGKMQNVSSSYLRKHQLSGGGWGPYPLSPAEAFDTAIAILALSKITGTKPSLSGARAWLTSQQNPDGSWPATTRPSGGESYAQQISTTAWVTLALLSTSYDAD